MDIPESKAQSLYTYDSITSIPASIFGGYYVNLVGPMIAGMTGSYITLTSSIIFLASVNYRRFWITVLGRLVYGLIIPVDIA